MDIINNRNIIKLTISEKSDWRHDGSVVKMFKTL